MMIYFKDGSHREVDDKQFVRITANCITVYGLNLKEETHYTWDKVDKVVC